jgi:hypothetical protein
MNKNVGSTDRIIRLITGVLFLTLPFVSGMSLFDSISLKLGSVIVSAVLIGTALFNFCPLYRVLGIRT